jgi:hypothetical protein
LKSVPNGAVNLYCIIIILTLSIGRGAINVFRTFTGGISTFLVRAVAPLLKGEQEPGALCRYPKGAMNEVALENVKGLLQDGGTGGIL